MQLLNAIRMLKRHGTEFKQHVEKGKSTPIIYSAKVGDSRMGFFYPCGKVGHVSATLEFDGKFSSFTGKSLTASIKYYQKTARQQAREDALSTEDYEELRQAGVLYAERH